MDIGGGLSYGENDNSTDNGCHNDEEDSTEERSQGDLLLQADVYSPEQLFESVSNTGRGKWSGSGRTYRQRDGHQVHVRKDIRDQDRENVKFGVGRLADCKISTEFFNIQHVEREDTYCRQDRG